MKKVFSTVGSSIFAVAGIALVSTVLLPSSAEAFTFNFGPDSQSSNSPATGASASVDFDFTQQGANVLISLAISNTTGTIPSFGDGATTSKLTGIGFDLLSGLSVVNGSFMSDGFLDTLILDADFNPFGDLDVGIADNNNFLGGNANGALSQGQSTNVSFLVSGTALVAANLEAQYLAAFQNDNDDIDIGARFQQVEGGNNNGASDKLLGGSVPTPTPTPTPKEVPEPTSILGIALIGGALRMLRRNKSEDSE